MITQIFLYFFFISRDVYCLHFVHMCICFRETYGRLANIATCAVLFKYCINKNKFSNQLFHVICPVLLLGK